MKSEFWIGFTYWWVGWREIFRRRRLLAFTLAPLTIAVLFFIGMGWWVLNHLGMWTPAALSYLLSANSPWANAAYYSLWAGFAIVGLIALVYLASILLTIVCSPFYSVMAVDVCRRRGLPASARNAGVVGFLLRPLFLVGISLGLFILTFVPVVNIVSLTASFFLLAYETLDYSFDALNWPFAKRIAYVLRRPGRWIGMAASLAVTLAVPSATFLVLPGAVVGAALTFND